MSVIKGLLAKRQASKGFFAAIGGTRTSGKSTLAGTLPGKTLLLQPAGVEAGNVSPVEKAKELGNELDMIVFDKFTGAFEILQDPAIMDYDNIYVDGISGFTDLVYQSPEFNRKGVKNKFEAFDFLKDQSVQLIVACKKLAEDHNKNTFVTYALTKKFDSAGVEIGVEMVAKGNATKDLVEGKGGNLVIAVAIPVTGEDGKTRIERKLVTKNFGPYTARLGDLLDHQNPGVIDANLAELLRVAGRITSIKGEVA